MVIGEIVVLGRYPTVLGDRRTDISNDASYIQLPKPRHPNPRLVELLLAGRKHNGSPVVTMVVFHHCWSETGWSWVVTTPTTKGASGDGDVAAVNVRYNG